MPRKKISSGSRFEELAKYSRAVLDDDLLIISGTVGADPATGDIPDSALEQARIIFNIIEDTLTQSKMTLNDVLHCRVFLTDVSHLEDVVNVLAEKFDEVRPANTTVICQLPVPKAKVEIEITARKRTED